MNMSLYVWLNSMRSQSATEGGAFVISRVLPPEEDVLFAPIAKKK